MSATVEYLSNMASLEQIAEHLSRCDADFVPPLSVRVDIHDYAVKIANKATRFEAWSGGKLVGLVAAYCNDLESRTAYITSVSVLRGWTGKGLAASLMNRCVEHARVSGMRGISLEVARENVSAVKLYERSGFVTGNADAPLMTMQLCLESGERA